MYQVLARYGLLKDVRIKCKSPLHPDRSGLSFSITPSGRGWSEFHQGSVDARGDVIDFVASMEGISKREAGALLIEWFGLDAELDLPKRYLSSKIEQLRRLLGGENPLVEEFLIEALKESNQNGKRQEAWRSRHAVHLFNTFVEASNK